MVIAQAGSLPSDASPTWMLNFLPPSSNNAIYGESLEPEKTAPEVTPDRVTAQAKTLYAMFTGSSRPTSPRRIQYQNRSDPAITVA